MYICQYSPRDIIYNAAEGNNFIHNVNVNGIDMLTFEATDRELYLALTLPEVVVSSITFKLILCSSGQFDIAVDQYTNNSENYNVDYLSSTIYINQITTGTLSVAPNTGGVLTATFSGLGHKVAQDRCIFRVKNHLIGTLLAGILLKVGT